jgi:hypothetical protein
MAEEFLRLHPITIKQAGNNLKMLQIMGNQGEIMAFAESGCKDIRIPNGLFLISQFTVYICSTIQDGIIQLP